MVDLDRSVRIAEAVRSAGGRALVVGGWVRDHLLGRDSKDIDIEVFGIAADRLRSLLATLGKVDEVGESFQVFKVGDVDVSLPRRESNADQGHRPKAAADLRCADVANPHGHRAVVQAGKNVEAEIGHSRGYGCCDGSRHAHWCGRRAHAGTNRRARGRGWCTAHNPASVT